MVNVIPSTRPRTTKSRGEIAIFNKFISDKKYDWTILHSQDLLFREYKWMGEIDYVVIIPKKGIVFRNFLVSSQHELYNLLPQ